MRRYETIVIIDPDLSEDDRNSLFTRVQEIVPQQNGALIEEDLWGPRKLAYAIKKKPRGFYARYDYCGRGALVDELERTLRIDDRVLKYLTVQLEEDADAEKILAEKAAAEAANAPETRTVTEAPVKAETEAAPSVEKPAEEAPVKAETEAAPSVEKPAEEAPVQTEAAAPSEGSEEPAEENAVEPADETSEKE